MAESNPTSKFVFPRWANYLLPVLILGVPAGEQTDVWFE